MIYKGLFFSVFFFNPVILDCLKKYTHFKAPVANYKSQMLSSFISSYLMKQESSQDKITDQKHYKGQWQEAYSGMCLPWAVSPQLMSDKADCISPELARPLGIPQTCAFTN